MSGPRVGEVMTHPVVTLRRDHSINLARGVMEMERIRHLPVVDGGRLVGLVSHRDIVQAQATLLAGPRGDDVGALATPVETIMQAAPRTVSPQTPVVEAARMLVDAHIGCLPVVDETGRLVGIVTATDFLELLIARLEAEDR